jgi:ketosteroid isomerase-like protein
VAQSPNVDVVRAALLAQNRGDYETFGAALDPQVEWDAGPNHVGLPERLRGRDAVVDAARSARERAGRLAVTLHEVRERDDKVLVLGTLRGASGPTMPRGWIFRMRDGRAVHVRAYGGRTAALSAWDRRDDD